MQVQHDAFVIKNRSFVFILGYDMHSVEFNGVLIQREHFLLLLFRSTAFFICCNQRHLPGCQKHYFSPPVNSLTTALATSPGLPTPQYSNHCTVQTVRHGRRGGGSHV